MSGFYTNHDQHFLAVDNIIFGFDADKGLMILLVKRKIEPQMGKWSLMGGFVRKDESLDEAAGRVVEELTGLKDVYMEQLRTYGKIARDPEARTVSVAYYTLIQVNHYNEELGKKHGAEWHPVGGYPKLIFDHNDMVENALKVLQLKTRSQPIGFELLSEKFTIPQLRILYEAINQKPLDHGNFSKKLHSMKLLVKLDEKDKSKSKKGAFYYRFDDERYKQLQEKGLLFDLK